jgi:hypothetical protein
VRLQSAEANGPAQEVIDIGRGVGSHAAWNKPGQIGTGVTAFDFLSADTNDGAPQPWLQLSDWTVPSEGSIPGLTPDSDSPPTINLPPELQSGHTHGHSHHTGSTQLLLDPSLASTTAGAHLGMPSSALPSCACLSTLYLTLNTLQSMDPSFPFPFALHPLREAMSTASEVLSCDQCPTKFLSALQSTQLVGTLLMSIAERFSKVLESISAESLRAELAGEEKKFRLADLNTSTSHLHTGGLGCAAAFSIDLTPAEWRSMCKKVVRAEVHGPSDGNHCCVYYVQLIQQMEDRQNHWHNDKKMPDDFPRDAEGRPMGGPNLPKEDHVCLKLCAYSRKLVDGFDWS